MYYMSFVLEAVDPEAFEVAWDHRRSMFFNKSESLANVEEVVDGVDNYVEVFRKFGFTIAFYCPPLRSPLVCIFYTDIPIRADN